MPLGIFLARVWLQARRFVLTQSDGSRATRRAPHHTYGVLLLSGNSSWEFQMRNISEDF
jgi:hypothetical protein